MKQKIMLAVGHKAFEEALIMKLKNRYDFVGVAPYREAVLGEALRNQPDIIVIRENLTGLANMSEIIYSLREKVQDARLIFMATDRQAGDEFLAALVGYGVYDIFVGANVKVDSIVALIEHPNTFGDVSMYAAKVMVDEKDNTKKLFETKIIQIAPQTQPEQKQKPIVPVLNTPKRKENGGQVIDEEIPLDFISKAETNGEIQLPKAQPQPKDVKFDSSFYSPNDYLTKTSKPVKQEIEKPVANKLPEKNTPDALSEFDFEIVDENGTPVSERHVEPVEVKKVVANDTVGEPKHQQVTQEQKPEEVKPVIMVQPAEETGEVIEPKQFIKPVETVANEVVENKSDDVEPINQPVKRNKLLNGNPFNSTVKNLLFVRTEEYCESHTALNVAIKLAKDDKKTLFIELSPKSCLDYFQVAGLDKLVQKSMHDFESLAAMISYTNEGKFDYVVVDSFIEDSIEPFLLVEGKKFLLAKQNKPWAQHNLKQGSRIGDLSKFFVIVLEEYTEFGISAKTIMADYRPYGVLRLKDKKETNFFAVNAKMPAMMAKKNFDTIEAYKELLNYIYERGEVVNE